MVGEGCLGGYPWRWRTHGTIEWEPGAFVRRRGSKRRGSQLICAVCAGEAPFRFQRMHAGSSERNARLHGVLKVGVCCLLFLVFRKNDCL